ncbi:MAG: class I SAM-dependent methyltransferase [Proteobacteria bacterium]|nr:class I SAM-dependent methyltransferase [Pseudomonadota bacterium]
MLSALLLSLALLGACATSSSRQSTAQELTNILAGDQRAEAHRARDVYRHPKETLLFFGIRPEMTVLEVWPEPGWYTEIIAPLLREKGKYYAALPPANPASEYNTRTLADFKAKLASRPDMYSKVNVVTLPADGSDVLPPGTLDMAVTFRNIHNFMADGTASQTFATLYRALKPGGLLGVVEHRGNPAVPQDPTAKSGYVNEDYAIKLIEAQGFRLVAKSQVNDNPKDTKDYPEGVWTLPPTFELKDTDRAKYAAIGESDRFTILFAKKAK